MLISLSYCLPNEFCLGNQLTGNLLLLSARPKENLKKMQVPAKFISVADIFPPAYQKEPCGHCLKIESLKILAKKS